MKSTKAIVPRFLRQSFFAAAAVLVLIIDQEKRGLGLYTAFSVLVGFLAFVAIGPVADKDHKPAMSSVWGSLIAFGVCAYEYHYFLAFCWLLSAIVPVKPEISDAGKDGNAAN